MRVVFFVGTLEAGGLERFVTRVCREAKARHLFDPVVVCLHKRTGVFLDELSREGIPVHAAPGRWYRSAKDWMGLVRVLRTTKAELVHSQVNFSLIQQFLAARLAGMSYLVTERNCYRRTGFALYRRRIQYYLLKTFGVQYSANSRRVADHLAEMLKEPVEKFPIFPNGITIESGDVRLDSRLKSRSCVTVAYIARMARHKGHMFFLEVLEKLVYQRGIDLKAVLIGDGPMRPTIERAVQEKKLSNFVQFTGIISNVEDRIREVDIVALFSDYEGMSNVVIEAMAVAKPVVATDTGNARELLESGAGLILDRKEANRAVELIESLILSPSKREEMGRMGQTIIEEQFSLSAILVRMVQNYHKFLRG